MTSRNVSQLLAGRWRQLIWTLFLAVVVGSFLSGLGTLLQTLGDHVQGRQTAMSFTTTADTERFGDIQRFWRASSGMQLIVGGYLLVDTLLFIPIYAMSMSGLRGVLRRRNWSWAMWIGRWRRWRLLLIVAVVADLLENLCEAMFVLLPTPPAPALQPLLRAFSFTKWGVLGLLLILLGFLALGRLFKARHLIGSSLLSGLGSIRDCAAYLWSYAVPLGMLGAGVGVIAAVPQTREILLGLRSVEARAQGSLLMSFIGLVAWLTASAWCFRLLDGLVLPNQPAASKPRPTRLRARHQLLLGISSLLATTQLLVTFIPQSNLLTAVVVTCGSVSIWSAVMVMWERLSHHVALPRNQSSKLLRASAVTWAFALVVVGLGVWLWLPTPDEALLRGLGFFQVPNRVWRFNSHLAYPSGIFTLFAAFLSTGLVLVGTQIDVRVSTAASRRIAALSAGLALWIAVALGTLEREIVLYQVALIAVLASIVWVLTRRAEDAAYKAWWDQQVQRVVIWVPKEVPAKLLSFGVGWLRGQVASQAKAPLRVFLLLLFALVIAGNVQQTNLATQLGTLTIVFLGLAAWGAIYTWLFVYLPKRHGLGNWTLAPLLWIFLASPGPRISDDQALDADPKLMKVPAMPTLHEHLIAWRKGLPDPQESPVFVVAAAGGGLRAAYWTATLLAEMDDRTCGQFGRHVLALSGVSGGSVGVALYAAQRRIWEQKRLPARCEPGRASEMRAMLRADYLSPLLASMLFADLPQAMVPYRYQTSDRNQALSRAFVERWTLVFPEHGDLLTRPMAQSVPGQFEWIGPSQPMLFLNATGVRGGRRVVASNVGLAQIPADSFFANEPVSRGFRLLTGNTSLIDAALNSARFPGLSPAGVVWGCSPVFVQGASGWCDETGAPIGRGVWDLVVDGGFFENSGVETIKDLLAALRAPRSLSIHGKLPPVFLVAISNDSDTHRICSGRDKPTPRTNVLGLDQHAQDQQTPFSGSLFPDADSRDGRAFQRGSLSALDALLSVREGRARLELRRSVMEFGCSFVVEWPLSDALPPRTPEPALGWLLSSASFDVMDAGVRMYAQAFPFDQTACPGSTSDPRAYLGGTLDQAKRCESGAAAAVISPVRQPSRPN